MDRVDKRDRHVARRGQLHARAEPDPGARAREPQAPDGGRRLKTGGADIRSKVRPMAANEGRYPTSAQCRLLGATRSTHHSMRSRPDRTFPDGNSAPMLVTARLKNTVEHEWGKRRYLDMSKLEEMDELKEKAEGKKRKGPRTAKPICERILTVP